MPNLFRQFKEECRPKKQAPKNSVLCDNTGSELAKQNQHYHKFLRYLNGLNLTSFFIWSRAIKLDFIISI